jgi:hypothetical protein
VAGRAAAILYLKVIIALNTRQSQTSGKKTGKYLPVQKEIAQALIISFTIL